MPRWPQDNVDRLIDDVRECEVNIVNVDAVAVRRPRESAPGGPANLERTHSSSRTASVDMAGSMATTGLASSSGPTPPAGGSALNGS